MGQLQVLSFKDKNVRIVAKNDQTWWIAKDVCNVLDISDARQAVSRLDDDERCLIPVTDSIGRLQPTFAVNEPGLYTLILGSRKPEAKDFKRWITHEVLPTIRKTGSYSIDRPKSQAELLVIYAQQFVEMEKRINLVEESVATIQQTIIHRDEDWRNWIKKAFNSAVMHSSEKDFQAIRSESYELLERRARCDLNARLRNLRKRLEEEGATKTKINSVNRMDVIEADPRLKEIYTSIVKELSIRLMPSVVN